MNKYIENLIVKNRSLIILSHDLLAIASAWFFAYIIRFNFEIPFVQINSYFFYPFEFIGHHGDFQVYLI